MEETVLSKVPENIFGRIQPKLAIFTTPNQEYNFIFPSLHNNGFRHDDHKFEWTRQEFRQWALNICKTYPNYRVAFHGMGATPSEDLNCGEASQMAIFARVDILQNYFIEKKNKEEKTDALDENSANGLKRYRGGTEIIEKFALDSKRFCLDFITPPNVSYKEILGVDFPVDNDCRSREEKILTEIVYYVNAKCDLRRYYNSDRNVFIISWIYILDRVARFHVDKKELLDILMDNNYQVEGDYIIVPKTETDSDEVTSEFDVNDLPDLEDDDYSVSSSNEGLSLDESAYISN